MIHFGQNPTDTTHRFPNYAAHMSIESYNNKNVPCNSLWFAEIPNTHGGCAKSIIIMKQQLRLLKVAVDIV